MTRLLVSVRSAAEARTALAGGADVIDVKEPAHGSLGRASTEVIREVIDAVAGCVPVRNAESSSRKSFMSTLAASSIRLTAAPGG